MGIEIDFLPVGLLSSSGDAIVIRYGDLNSPRRTNWKIAVIDGGDQDAGKLIVNHINTFYDTNTVDYMFLTHPDTDHASGLTVVMDEMKVDYLFMHQPWDHAGRLLADFKDGRSTPGSLSDRIRKGLAKASELEEMASEKNVNIYPLFAGDTIDNNRISVLGPSREFYDSCLPHFDQTPPAKYPAPSRIIKSASDVIVTERFDWPSERLVDPPEDTSFCNQSSMILLFQIDGAKFLLTGDAGVPSLLRSATFAEKNGIGLDDLTFFQVPHHGSKRNVSPEILNKYRTGTAFISAAVKGAPDHPAQVVINALKRRATNVYVTQGRTLRHSHNAPQRTGWVSATGSDFVARYEE